MQHYFYDGRDLSQALKADYDNGLVVLSIAIVSLASYAALSVAGRIRAAESDGKRRIWLLAGAFTMGGGVWAMHFIAMLALRLPLAVSYDVSITILSTTPVILSSYAMLEVISRPKISQSVVLASVAMGLGIGAMHYIGMAAMQGISRQLIMLFEPKLFALSILIALALSGVALTIDFLIGRNKKGAQAFWAKIGAALTMGFAVSGMHYTAMAATYFFAGEASPDWTQSSLNPAALVFWVSFTSVLIASLAIFITIVDRRIQQATYEEAVSRSRMREAIESIADGFCLFDMEDRLVECNQRYREIMNFGTPIMPGMSFEAIMRGAAEAGLILDADGRLEDWLNERATRHRTPRENFVEHFIGDRWMRVSERRVWNTGTVAIRTDITELKQTEIELSKAIAEAQKARAIAEEANSAKSAFLANMSHELRTPMNAIIGYSEMLLEDARESESHTISDLMKIHASAVHLLAIINEILDLSKIEAGKMELCLEVIHLPSVIDEAVNTVRPIIDKNSNKLFIHCPDSLPAIKADAIKLRQILLNLLSNAGKFTHAGEIDFSVAVEAASADGWIVLQVRDTGIGMSRDQVDKVFAAFTQADNSTTRQYGGTGLGLTITKKFCEMMGGTIAIDSEPGRGSVFIVKLPLALGD
ncbi:MHYT domain-containing protein [Methylomicrobium lacus]|uniref:sensor histidine kinase n=1 Tax=Methylomicrobium lacus TaxID=136992 RepID=UPI0035A84EF6